MTTFSNQGNQRTESEDRARRDMAKTKQDAGAVKEDLRALKEDAKNMATHAKDEAIHAVKSGAESVSEMARSAGDSATEYHERFCRHVAAKPTSSVLIALGIGVIAGRCLAGRR